RAGCHQEGCAWQGALRLAEGLSNILRGIPRTSPASQAKRWAAVLLLKTYAQKHVLPPIPTLQSLHRPSIDHGTSPTPPPHAPKPTFASCCIPCTLTGRTSTTCLAACNATLHASRYVSAAATDGTAALGGGANLDSTSARTPRRYAATARAGGDGATSVGGGGEAGSVGGGSVL
ncbi:MAG: hypothetical protein AAF485_00150, partial [Chloroflexota bacterium]